MKISDIFKRQAAYPSRIISPFIEPSESQTSYPEEGRTEPDKLIPPNAPAAGGEMRGLEGAGESRTIRLEPRWFNNGASRALAQGEPVIRTKTRTNVTPGQQMELPPYTNYLDQSKSIPNSKFPIAGPEECNCSKVLGIDPATSTNWHADVVNSIMDHLDDPSKIDKLKEIKMAKPTVDAEFKNHVDHHLYNAGMTPADLGINAPLGKQHVETRNEADLARAQALNPPQYNSENCGVCKQYMTSIKNSAINHRDQVKNAIMMGTAATPEDAERSANSIIGDIYEDHKNGVNPTKQFGHLRTAQDTMTKWDDHMRQAHGEPLAVPDTNRNIPVIRAGSDLVNRNNGRNPLIHSLYREIVQHLAPGWNIKRRPEVPKRSPTFNEETGDNLTNQDMTETERAQYAQGLINRGEVNTYTMPGRPSRETTIPAVPFTSEEKERASRDRLNMFHQTPDGFQLNPETSGRPWGLEPRSVRKITEPSSPDVRVVELPWQTIHAIPQEEKLMEDQSGSGLVRNTVGGYLTKERVFTHVHGYEPSEDTRLQLGEPSGSVPDMHSYLFNRAKVKPDTEGIDNYNKAMAAYETQPTHKIVNTGELEITKVPVTKTIPGSHAGYLERKENFSWSNPDSWELHTPESFKKRLDEERNDYERTITRYNSAGKPMDYDPIERNKQLKKWQEDKYPYFDTPLEGKTRLEKQHEQLGSTVDKLSKELSDPSFPEAKKEKHQRRIKGLQESMKKLSDHTQPKTIHLTDKKGKKLYNTVRKPVSKAVPIPESEKLTAPTELERINGMLDYQRSFSKALGAAYPGIGTEEAMGKLKRDHAEAVEKSRSRSLRVQSSKKFNSAGQRLAYLVDLDSDTSDGPNIPRPALNWLGGYADSALFDSNQEDQEDDEDNINVDPQLAQRQRAWDNMSDSDKDDITESSGIEANPYHHDHDPNDHYGVDEFKHLNYRESSANITINRLYDSLNINL